MPNTNNGPATTPSGMGAHNWSLEPVWLIRVEVNAAHLMQELDDDAQHNKEEQADCFHGLLLGAAGQKVVKAAYCCASSYAGKAFEDSANRAQHRHDLIECGGGGGGVEPLNGKAALVDALASGNGQDLMKRLVVEQAFGGFEKAPRPALETNLTQPLDDGRLPNSVKRVLHSSIHLRRLGGALGLGQLGPDQVPVIRAEVLTTHLAECGALDGYTVLRRWLATVMPMAPLPDLIRIETKTPGESRQGRSAVQ